VLSVILQEQHRNPAFRSYVSESFIKNELFIKTIFDMLKKLNIIRQDADPDFWMKITSSLLYTFSNRMLLGIGDTSPDFSGKGLLDLMRELFDMMFKMYGVKNEKKPLQPSDNKNISND
jgi:hypothetical protein